MAPELLAAAGKSMTGIDAVRADVFSLGVVVIELLSGARPLPPGGPGPRNAPGGIVRRGVTALPTGLSPAVAAILSCCLDPDPTRRPASAGVLAAGLDRAVYDWRHRGRLRCRRLLALAVALALLGSGLMAWLPTPQNGQLTRSSEQAPDQPAETSAAFFDRGRAHLRAGDTTAARADFLASYDRSRDPQTLALVAYCLALGGQHGPSIDLGRQAIKEGAASAEVYNNLGYALSQSSRPAEAIPELDEALRLFPRLQAALYNRAVARYRATLTDGRGDLRAADDITSALALGPTSADLHFDAARIYAVCSSRESRFRAEACEQVQAAVRAGKDPTACQKDVVLASRLGGDAAFEAAYSTPRGKPPLKPAQLRLVEPYR
jgi:tetratricopeptide (TPR) repeat protein